MQHYGDRTSYFSEDRQITKQGNEAKTLLRAVELSGITAEELTKAFSAFSGRLSLTTDDKGRTRLHYCAGQYFPTEYRAAVCAVLASALWNYHREDVPAEVENKGEWLRKSFASRFGRSIGRNWFN